MKFSFLGQGQETPPLQLYGKLPVAKDYLRIGCGDGAGRELREWLDRTFGTVRDASAALTLAGPLRFIGQGDRSPLQGYLWPSADAGERRSFPFTVFIERRRKALLADLDQGNLAEAEGVWRVLAEARDSGLGSADGQALLDEFRGRDVDVQDIEEVVGAPADLDSWVAAIWGADGRDELMALFERVGQLARDAHAGPYRLPLVCGLPLRDQVIAWTHLLRELGALALDEVPTLFFPPRALVPSSEPACLVVSRRPLRDDEVTWLTATPEEDLGPADFAAGIGGADPDDGPGPDGDVWLRESLLAAVRASGAGGA